MDKDTQKIGIIFLGLLAVGALLQKQTDILYLIIGIIGGFIAPQTMTEKQQNTLEKYHLKHALEKGTQDDKDILMGSVEFETEDEMNEYLATHTIEDMITDTEDNKGACTNCATKKQ